MRKIKLENNTFYHVYNRGANQNNIFFFLTKDIY